METTTKIQARIVNEIENGAATMREAVTEAARKATVEAQEAGWSTRTIAGMWQTFANVAADMMAAAIAEEAA